MDVFYITIVKQESCELGMWRNRLIKVSYSRNNELRFGAKKYIGYKLPASSNKPNCGGVCEAGSQVVQAPLEPLIILPLPPNTRLTGMQYHTWHRAQSFGHRMFRLIFFLFRFFSLWRQYLILQSTGPPRTQTDPSALACKCWDYYRSYAAGFLHFR